MDQKSTSDLSPVRFSFDEAARADLDMLGLTSQAIADLEREADRQRIWIEHARSAPATKEWKRELEPLRKKLASIMVSFDKLSDYNRLMHPEIFNCQLRLAGPISASIEDLDRLISEKERPGRRQTELDALVCTVAITMLKHNIIPKKHGSDFGQILQIVFTSIGEEAESIDAAIEKAWCGSTGDIHYYSTGRTHSIKELIDIYERRGPADFEAYLLALPDE